MWKNNSPKKGRFLKKSKKVEKNPNFNRKIGKINYFGGPRGFWSLFDPKGSAPHRKMGSEPVGAEKVTFWGSAGTQKHPESIGAT